MTRKGRHSDQREHLDTATMTEVVSHGRLLGAGMMGCMAEEVGRGQVTEVVGLWNLPNRPAILHPLSSACVYCMTSTYVTASWVCPNVRFVTKPDMKVLPNHHTTISQTSITADLGPQEIISGLFLCNSTASPWS